MTSGSQTLVNGFMDLVVPFTTATLIPLISVDKRFEKNGSSLNALGNYFSEIQRQTRIQHPKRLCQTSLDRVVDGPLFIHCQFKVVRM